MPKAKGITRVQPLADRVLIKPAAKEEVTKSGIVIPDTAKEKPQEGEIIAAGPGKLNDKGVRIPLEVTVGDRVMYARYAGTEIKIDGDEHLVLREEDILAIVEK